MATLPDDVSDAETYLERALKLLNERREVYIKRRDMYRGTNAEVISHPALEKLLNKYATGEHFGLTYAAVPVDALMDRVDLSGLRVAKGSETLTKTLQDALWNANDLDDDADDFHTKAGYLGDYYALVTPHDMENPSVGIDILGKHPLNAVIVYDAVTEREPEVGWYQWRSGRKQWRGNLVFEGGVIEYIADEVEGGHAPDKAEKWTVVADDEAEDGVSRIVFDESWPFPMFHFRPDSKPYGTPVNERGYGAQEAITKLNATDMATIDWVGFPQRYALLDPEAEMDDDIADDFNDAGTTDPPAEDTDASTVVDRKGGRIKGVPGSAWLLRGVKQAGQFEAMQGTPFQDREEFQIRSMAVLTRTPLYEFMPDTADAPSGEARRRADGSITKHAKKIMGTFGRTWSSIGECALAMMGVGEDAKVEPVWQPPEIATDAEGMALVSLKTANGVPLSQALIEAGYTEEQVSEWLPEGDDEVAISLDMLKALAPALQALGNAITLTSASNEDVRLMLPQWLKGAAPEPKPAPVPFGTPGAPGTPVPVPTGKFNADGTPEMAPPKGVTPPQLAPHTLPPSGVPKPPAPPAKG